MIRRGLIAVALGVLAACTCEPVLAETVPVRVVAQADAPSIDSECGVPTTYIVRETGDILSCLDLDLDGTSTWVQRDATTLDKDVTGTWTFPSNPTFSEKNYYIQGGAAGNTGTTGVEWWPFSFVSKTTDDKGFGMSDLDTWAFSFQASTSPTTPDRHTVWRAGTTNIMTLSKAGVLSNYAGDIYLNQGHLGSLAQDWDADLDELAALSCSAGQVAAESGGGWYCTDLSGGGDMLASVYDTDSSGAVDALDSGTSFPGTPSTGDVFIVTDDSAAGACDSAAGSAKTVCRWSGAAWEAVGDGGGGGGGTPGGSPAELQYNNSGSFAGVSSATYDGTNLTLSDGLLYDLLSSTSKVRAYDFDADGTLEMTDLQSIVTTYGANTHLVIPRGTWVAPDDSSNTSGLVEVTVDNVHIECEAGAVLSGPAQYVGDATATSTTVLTVSGTPFAGHDLTNYTAINATDGTKCTVTSNTDGTATCSGGLAADNASCTASGVPYTCCTGSGTGTCALGDGWTSGDDYVLERDVLSAVYVSGDQFSIRGCEIDGGNPSTGTYNLNGTNKQKHGIRLVGSDTFWVLDNFLHDLNHSGVVTTSASRGVIANNHVLRTGRWGSTPVITDGENGIQIFTDTVDSDTRQIIVANNTVEKFTANGIALRRQDQNDTVQDIVISGNTIYDQELSNGSCILPTGADNVIVSNTTARNCRLYTAGGSDWFSNGTSGSTDTSRNLLIDGFRLDNSAWTVASQDAYFGDYNELMTIRDVIIISQGGTEECLAYDPPNKDLEVDGLTLIDCAGGAADGAIYVQNIGGAADDAGVAGHTVTWKRVRIINPTVPALRSIVSHDYWVWDDWRVTGSNTGAQFRFLFDAASFDHIEMRHIRFETSATASEGIEFTAADVNDSVFDDITCMTLNQECVHLEQGGADNSFSRIRAYHTASGSGALDTGTATGSRTSDIWCENASSTCVKGSAPDRGIIYKASDESITSDTTLSNDSDLVVPVTAGNYKITFYAYYSAHSDGDLKLSIACPGSPTDVNIAQMWYEPNATEVNSEAPKTFCGFTTSIIYTPGSPAAFTGWYRAEVWIDNTTTGNVALQWAQSSSDTNATSVLAGSWVEWQKLSE